MNKLFITAALLLLSISMFAEPLIFEVKFTEGYTKNTNDLIVAFHKDKPSDPKCAKILKDTIKLCLEIDDSKDIMATAMYNNPFIEKLFYDSSKKEVTVQKNTTKTDETNFINTVKAFDKTEDEFSIKIDKSLKPE